MPLPSTRPPSDSTSPEAAVAQARQQVMVMWIIWFALISGVLLMQFALGRGIPRGANLPTPGIDPMLLVIGAQFLGAMVVRWLFLTQARPVRQQLVLMVIGLALSEGAVIFEIFLIPADQPATRLTVLVVGLAIMLQFAPLYARPGAAENRLPGVRDKRP